MEFWLEVAKRFNAGEDPKDIANSIINTKTNRPYRREHIYWILRKLKSN